MQQSGKSMKQRGRVIRAAEGWAFESYLRRGRTTAPSGRAGAAALSRKGLGDAKPTSYYTWRTAHDERVRASHAANDGRVFAWSDPPTTGHPGHEHNCRCWAEPYYGTPFVSDTTLALSRRQRTDTTGQEPWQLIETLTRPDGSLAESRMLMRDGTRIVSTFNGGLVVNEVTLPDGRLVSVHRRDGVQSIFVGDALKPVVQSVWTANGPRIAVPRTLVALDGSPFDLMPRLVAPDDPFTPHRFGEVEILEPGRPGGGDPGGAGGAIGLALMALFLASHSAKPELGAGTEDKPALTIRIWTPDGKLTPHPVSVDSLTAEQVAQNCKRLPEVQQWTDQAALALAPRRTEVSAATWGRFVHDEIERMFRALKDQNPSAYADTWAERSYSPDALPTTRSSKDSSRLDIIEVRDDAICIYDIKTGRDFAAKQLEKYLRLAASFGKLTFYVIQIKPTLIVDKGPS